jgi:Flp pilus assembly protein TadB
MDDNNRTDRIEDRLDRLGEQTRQELQSIDVRLTRIETRLDQTATKTDLQQAMNSMVKWMVGMMFGAGVAAVTIMTFVLNNATPRPPGGAVAPVIIQLPPFSQAPPTTRP